MSPTDPTYGALLEQLLQSLDKPGSSPQMVAEALLGRRQIWWRRCQEAVREDPGWLSGPHPEAIRDWLTATTGNGSDRGAGSVRAAVDTPYLVARVLTGQPGSAQAVSELAKVTRPWDHSGLLLPAQGTGLISAPSPATAGAGLAGDVASVIALLSGQGDELGTSSESARAEVAVTALLLAGAEPLDRHVVQAPVVFSRADDRGPDVRADAGVAGFLEVREFAAGPAGLFPDPRSMTGGRAVNADFAEALAVAWRYCGGDRCVLWRITIPDETAWIPVLAGGSLGAAFTLCLADLLRNSRRPVLGALRRAVYRLRPGTAVTGRIDHQGVLHWVGDMGDKLRAAHRKRWLLVAPEENKEDFGQAPDPRLVKSADTIALASRYAHQWRKGRLAVVVGLAAVLAVATGLIIQAKMQVSKVNETSIARELLAQSESVQSNDPAVAALAAADAWELAPSNDMRDQLIDTATNPLAQAFPSNADALAVSPDSRVLAVISSDRTSVTLWSLPEQRAITQLTGLGAQSVDRIAFAPIAPGGVETLAVEGFGQPPGKSTRGGVVTVYRGSGEHYTQTGFYYFKDFGVDAVAFSVTGTLAMVTGTVNTTSTQTLRLYPPQGDSRHKPVVDIMPEGMELESLAFASDGTLAVGAFNQVLIFGPQDDYAAPWSVLRGDLAVTIDGLCGFTRNGFLVIGTLTGSNTGLAVYRRDGNQLTKTQVLPDEETAALGADSLAAVNNSTVEIYVFDQADGQYFDAGHITAPDEPTILLSPDGQTLIVTSHAKITVYRTAPLTGDSEHITATPDGGPNDYLASDPGDSRIVAIAGESRDVIVRNIVTNAETAISGTGGTTGLAFAPDGALAVIGKQVTIFPDPVNNPARRHIVPGTKGATQVRFSASGALAVAIATGPALTSTDRLLIYPTGNDTTADDITLHGPKDKTGIHVWGMSFGPGGQLALAIMQGYLYAGVMIVTPQNHDVQYIAIPNMKNIPAATGTGYQIEPVAFAPDGTLAVNEGYDIRLYSANSYTQWRTIAGSAPLDASGFVSIAFSPNGILLTCAQLGGLAMWDYQENAPKPLATFALSTHGERLPAQFALSLDGQFVTLALNLTQDPLNPYSSKISPYLDLVTWDTPYLDGKNQDGVSYLCGQFSPAPSPADWESQLPAIPYPSVCRPPR